MGYRLVRCRDLYKDDVGKVVNPFFAAQILKKNFAFPQGAIMGLRSLVSSSNTEAQRKRLLKEIQNGQIVLLDDSFLSGIGTIERTGLTGLAASAASRMSWVQKHGKKRPVCGAVVSGNSAEKDEAFTPHEEELVDASVKKQIFGMLVRLLVLKDMSVLLQQFLISKRP